MLNQIEQKTKRAYTFAEIEAETSLSQPFLRLEEKRGRLRVVRFGRRTIVLAEDFENYLQNGSNGAKSAMAA